MKEQDLRRRKVAIDAALNVLKTIKSYNKRHNLIQGKYRQEKLII